VLKKIITYIRQETFLSLVLNSQIWANSAEFRMFFKKSRIPSEVKNALPWTP
jgi:hypothetical protein